MHSLPPPKLLVLAPKQLLACYLTYTHVSYSETYFLCPYCHQKQPVFRNSCEACCSKRQSKYKPCRLYFGRVVSCCCASKQMLLQQAALLNETPLKWN